MVANQATYPPLDVLKPVADDIWIVDSGPLKVAGIPFPVRMTVIRVGEDILLHSPTRYGAALHDAIRALGPIRHLIAPSFAHWVFLADWAAACPDATTWAAPGMRDRRPTRAAGLRLDHDLGTEPPPAWAGTLDQSVVPGGAGFWEIVFLHRPSRTVLLTDLVLNLELQKLPRAARAFARLVGIAAPDGRAPIYLRALVRLRGREARAAVTRVLAWDPERVIIAHGRWFERDGAAALRRSLRWLVRS